MLQSSTDIVGWLDAYLTDPNWDAMWFRKVEFLFAFFYRYKRLHKLPTYGMSQPKFRVFLASELDKFLLAMDNLPKSKKGITTWLKATGCHFVGTQDFKWRLVDECGYVLFCASKKMTCIQLGTLYGMYRLDGLDEVSPQDFILDRVYRQPAV